MPEESERWDFVPWKHLLWIFGALTVLGGLTQLPPIHWHRGERAPRMACRNNLRQVVIGCLLYADENDGRLPDSLQRLCPAFMDGTKFFSCPSKPSSHEDFAKGVATEKSSSYRVVPSLRTGMPGDFILAYEASLENHRDGRTVGFLDSSVEWWPADREAEFQRRLAEQAEKVRNWRPAASNPAGAK